MVAFDPWALAGLVALSSVVASVPCLWYAVRTDANARGANGDVWAPFVLFASPIAGPVYLLYRRRLPVRTVPIGATERRVGSFGIGVPAAWLTAGILSPPDPFTVVLHALALTVVLVPAAALVCYEPSWRARMSR